MICALCEFPIEDADDEHLIALNDGSDRFLAFCDECWQHRREEIDSLLGVDE